MATLEITFGDRTYEYDPDTLLMSELREIKKLTSWSRRQWLEALGEDDPDAITTLVYLLRRREGEKVRYDDIDAPYSTFMVRVLGDVEPDPQIDVEDDSPTSTPTTP